MNIRNQFANVLLAALITSVNVICAVSAKAASTSSVVGWPFSKLDTNAPPVWLGTDPIIGRLSCPPLTRLNLSKEKFEPLIFNRVTEQDFEDGSSTWTYGIRNGIYWWSGDPVVVNDIADYLTENLPRVIAYKTGSVWKQPEFEVTAQKHNITVKWKTKPKFGPYILNGAPLWRRPKGEVVSENSLRYECAGIYSAKNMADHVYLSPSKKYRSSSKIIKIIHPNKFKSNKGSRSTVRFKMASDLPSVARDRAPDTRSKCNAMVDLPLLTAISWNLNSKKIKNSKLKALVHLMIPLNTILSSGAGFYGDLVSGPVPKLHPGYNKGVKVAKFDLKSVAKELDIIGLNKKNRDGIRLDEKGKPLSIKIGRLGKQIDILEKVIGDIFLTLGIELEFSEVQKANVSQVDGVIYTARIPWPEMSLLANFHSKSNSNFPFKLATDKDLDKKLEDYAIAVTHGDIDKDLLKDIHKKISESNLFSAMIHHSTCLEMNSKNSKAARLIDVSDPDWFRKIILR